MQDKILEHDLVVIKITNFYFEFQGLPLPRWSDTQHSRDFRERGVKGGSSLMMLELDRDSPSTQNQDIGQG